MKLSFSGLLVTLAVANARELRALQDQGLQDAGESGTDKNQGEQDSTSLAEKLRRNWLLDTPTITYDEAGNTIHLFFEESTDKLNAANSFKEQFYDFKCRNDQTTTYLGQWVSGASLTNGDNGFGAEGDSVSGANYLWSMQDGIEWDWTVTNPTNQAVVVSSTLTVPNPNPNGPTANGLIRTGTGCGGTSNTCGWKNIPNTAGNLAGQADYAVNPNNNPGPQEWDPNDGDHDFPPCSTADGCPGFPKFSFQLTPADVADNVRVYEKVGKHPGIPGCDGTECQSRLDPNKKYPKDDEGKGIMRFCVRTNVGYVTDSASNPGGSVSEPLTGGASFREVNFLETLVTIKYTLEAGFTIDAFAVEPKEREEVTAIKDSYELEAYLCNPEKRHAQEIGKAPDFPGIDLPHPPTVADAVLAGLGFCAAGGTTVIGTTQGVVCNPGELRNVPKAITKFNTGSITDEGEEDYVDSLPGGNLTPNPTATPIATDAFNQGALITVCVRPNADTWKDGVRLASLQTFDWYRDVPPVKQQAIVNGEQAPNMLTAYNAAKTVTAALFETDATSAVGQSSNHVDGFIEFPINAGDIGNANGPADYSDKVVGGNGNASKQHGLCQDAAEWCTFSSILFADFYKNAGEVFGVGTAFLEFKRRRLGDANKPDGDAARKLQDSGGSSPFDLVVRTNLADDGPGALKTAGGASYGVTLVATAMALLSAALLA